MDQPAGPTARRIAVLPALAESRRLRLFALFLLYVAQGVPIGLFWFAIPAWMAANGADARDVAYVLGLTALPWSLKLAKGFFMDRYTFLAMGRRRVWLIGAQLVMIVLLVACAVIGPEVKDIALLAAVGFAVNLATTFQDVAVDGLAVDIMEEDERARAAGMMFGGQMIGMSLATALSGAAIVAYGPGAAYLLSALFIACVIMFVIVTAERPGERLLPWSSGRASAVNQAVQATRWWPILKSTWTAILRPISLLWLPIVLIKGVQFGLLTGATPLIATGSAGWSEGEVTALVGTGQLIAGIAGMTIGGYAGDRLGAKWATILAYGCWLALNMVMLLTQPLWADDRFLTAFVIAWLLLDTLVTIATIPTSMRLCDRTVAATQFTLYMALSNFGITLSAGLLGFAEEVGGIAGLFGLLALANVAAIAIMLAVRFPARQIDEAVADRLAPADGLAPAIN